MSRISDIHQSLQSKNPATLSFRVKYFLAPYKPDLIKLKLTVLMSPFTWWLSSRESTCHAGDQGSIPGSGRTPGGGDGNPLQYSRLRNPWTEEPRGLQSTRSQESETNQRLNKSDMNPGDLGEDSQPLNCKANSILFHLTLFQAHTSMR